MASYQSPPRRGFSGPVFNLTGIKVNADKGLPPVNADTPIYTKNARYLQRRDGGIVSGVTPRDSTEQMGFKQSGYVDTSQST